MGKVCSGGLWPPYGSFLDPAGAHRAPLQMGTNGKIFRRSKIGAPIS